MAFNPRKLRHRIDIESPASVQNPTTGETEPTWNRVHSNVPAEIVPLSVREFAASQALQSQIVARVTIRYRDGLDAKMRILHNGKIYNPQGWQPDPDSGLNYVTAPCTMGVNEG